MSGYHLCQIKKAKHPYYIESISTNIFTIEELCFYLQQNIYLIDETIINEKLCDWVRDELGLKKLYRKLYEQLDRQESIGNFILPVFKEIEYLSHAEFRKLHEQISNIEIQPQDMRKKLKADYLVNFKMYGNAINLYYQILKERNPGNMGVRFYASVLNNMAMAYAKLFLFEEAADCLWQSYGIVRSNQTYTKYISLLPLYLTETEYEKKLEQLCIPKEQREKIETKNSGIRKGAPELEGDISEWVEKEKKKYQKSTCM